MAQQTELTQAEIEALREILRPSLFRKAIPSEARDRLIEKGYVEQKLGDLVATAKGRACVARPVKRRKRAWHPS
jgi:hypothetical protein